MASCVWMEGWMKKRGVYPQRAYQWVISSHEMGGNPAVCDTRMDPGGILLREVSRPRTNTV